MTRIRFRRVALAVAAVAVGVCASTAASTDAKVPRNFFGLQGDSIPSAREFARLGHGHVQIYRFSLFWATVAPCPTCRNWSEFDRLIGDAARSHIRTLPILIGSPSYAASQPSYPPETATARSEFAAFVRDAVKRYGSHGTFWSRHRGLPRLPPPGWEVWDEPNIGYFWNGSPNAPDYVNLLRLTRNTIRSVNPREKTVLAGVTNTRAWSIQAWIKALYAVPGFSQAFDVLAVHPYSAGSQGDLVGAQLVRNVANANHDGRKPLWMTEMGWASGGPKGYFTTSARGQAGLLRRTFKLLLRHRRQLKLGMIVWFQWRDRKLQPGEADWWEPHTGLFTLHGRPKPAWRAFVSFTRGRAGRGRLR